MEYLTNEKKKNLLKIQHSKSILNNDLENNLISDDEIYNLFNKPSDYGITNDNFDMSYKDKILKLIYNCPFLLCDQECLDEKIKKVLPLFLDFRYNTELMELNKLLELKDISIKEYITSKDILEFCYYKTSEEGKDILKKEKTKCLTKNK